MKIKEVCDKTKLTERTVRFYLEKALIAPASFEMNGRTYYEFGEEDVSRLLEVATLRKAGFTIDSIIEMRNNPGKIATIFDTRYYTLKENSKDTLELIKILEQVKGKHFPDVAELAKGLQNSTSDTSLPRMDIEPDFSKFDSETLEEKEEAYLDFRVHQRIRENRERFFKPVKIVASACLLLSCIFLLLFFISGLPHRIEKDYNGVQFHANSEDSIESTNVRISGKLYKRWFSQRVFKGSIEIGNIEYTKGIPVKLSLSDGLADGLADGKDSIGWLNYHMVAGEGNDVKLVTKSAAIVWIKDNFEQMVFWLTVPSGSESGTYTDLVLCAPANNRSDGTQMLADFKLLGRLN